MNLLDYEMAAIVQADLKEKGVLCRLGCTVKAFENKGDKIDPSYGRGRRY